MDYDWIYVLITSLELTSVEKSYSSKVYSHVAKVSEAAW
jgi:hypothetical protein